jgi:uncharacterized protein GlcG (DUF336 family)
MMKLLKQGAALCVAIGISAAAFAQQGPMPYGTPISLDMAKKAMAAAEAEAKKNNWPMAIAIVDSGSHLVLLQRLDNTQTSSVEISQGKATTAAGFRRPTKALEDALAGGGSGLRVLSFAGAVLADGGLPIVVDGKIVGAIGVSGMQGFQDAQVAKAGADALK